MFAHSALREQILLKVLDLVNSECAALCRKTGADGPSPLCRLPLKNVEEFSRDIYIQELKLRGPFLLKLFRTLVQHNEHRNMTKQGPKHTPGICMSIAVLLQEQMTGIQTCVSCSIQPCSKASKFAVHTSYATSTYACIHYVHRCLHVSIT